VSNKPIALKALRLIRGLIRCAKGGLTVMITRDRITVTDPTVPFPEDLKTALADESLRDSARVTAGMLVAEVYRTGSFTGMLTEAISQADAYREVEAAAKAAPSSEELRRAHQALLKAAHDTPGSA
jgi:hypothetical protein